MIHRKQSPRWGAILILIAALLVLSACDAAGGQNAASTGGLQVWLDQPPDGANIPLGVFMLKAHARDVSGPGVKDITFLVNSIAIGTVPTDPTAALAYAEMEWNPSAPGLYEIQAQASNGTTVAYSDVANVCVGSDCQIAVAEVTDEPVTPTVTNTLEPGVTPSITPTRTPSPTPTLRAVPTTAVPTCTMAAPVLGSPPNGGTVTDPLPTFSWRYSSDCKVEGFAIEVSTDPGMSSNTYGGGTGNPSTSWTPGAPLPDCTTFYWRVRGGIGTTFGPYSETWSFSTAYPGGQCGGSNDIVAPVIELQNFVPRDQSTYSLTQACTAEEMKTEVWAIISDDQAMGTVMLSWRYRKAQASGAADWTEWFNMTMEIDAGTTYMSIIDNSLYLNQLGSLLGGSNGILEIYILASDAAGNTAEHSSTIPLVHCGKV